MRYEDVFQLVMLVLFLTVFLGRSTMLYLKGVKVFVIAEGKSGPQRALELLFFAALPAWMYAVVVSALGHPLPGFLLSIASRLFDSAWLRAAGVVLIASGFMFFAAALAAFGRSWRIGIDTKKPGELVTGGIFRLTRNPVFLFIDLYFIGTFLVYPNLLFLLFMFACAAGIHLQILQEEKFLLLHYGKTYRDYMEQTGRYA